MNKYYFIYDAYNDVCEPISRNDAERIASTQTEQNQIYNAQMKGQRDTCILDGDILVAVRWRDLKGLEKLTGEQE